MTFEESLKISNALLLSIGGSSVIILGLSSWLGKVWATRILAKEKSSLNKELESYRNQLELAKLALTRYSEQQFTLYNKLWSSLCDLKIAGIILWNNANVDNLINFSEKLRQTKEDVLKNALLIEEEHYKRLNELFKKFSDYQVGKMKLIQIRRDTVHRDLSRALAEHTIIQDNESQKKAFEDLLLLIEDSFRKQICSTN